MVRQKLITVLSILVLLVLYFWGHNVGEASLVLRGGIFTTASLIGTIGLVFLLIALGGAIGRRTMQAIDRDDLSTGEKVVLDSLLGLGIISAIAATLGLIGQFNFIIWGVVLVLAIVCFGQFRAWLTDVSALIFRSGRPETPWERFVRAFILLTVTSALLLALAPPYAWDALNYHLVIPQRYVEAGVLGQHLDNHFFGFPQNIEMLFGMLMLFGTKTAPAVLHWSFGVMSLIAIYNFVQRNASSKAAAVSVSVVMASFSFWILMGWAYVDIALMAYGTGAVIAIHQWATKDAQRTQWLATAIVLVAITAGIKYTSIPLIIALYLFVLWRDPKQIVRHTLLFAGIGFVLFVPWLVKGIALYENPVYPYLFGGANWDSIRAENFSSSGDGLLGTPLAFHIPIVPIAATLFGVNRVSPYSFTTGAFWLLMPFLLLLGYSHLPEKSKAVVKTVTPLAIVVAVFWMVLSALSGIGAQTRLMLIGGSLPAILSGMAFHSLENWKRRPIDIIFITQAAIILSIFLGMYDYLDYFAEKRALEYHTENISEDQYLQRNLGILYDAMLALETLPEGSRVLFLWEPKTFYCPDSLTCTGDVLFDNWARPLQMGASPDNLISRWQANYDYMLLFDLNINGQRDGFSLWTEIQEFAEAENALFPDYFFDATQEIWSDDIAYTLYEWR